MYAEGSRHPLLTHVQTPGCSPPGMSHTVPSNTGCPPLHVQLRVPLAAAVTEGRGGGKGLRQRVAPATLGPSVCMPQPRVSLQQLHLCTALWHAPCTAPCSSPWAVQATINLPSRPSGEKPSRAGASHLGCGLGSSTAPCNHGKRNGAERRQQGWLRCWLLASPAVCPPHLPRQPQTLASSRAL